MFYYPHQISLPICEEFSCLSTCRKPISSLSSFLIYCKEISILSFWTNMGMSGHNHAKWWYQFQELLMCDCRQKINFILHVFLEIWERYCKIVILGTLGIPGYAHSKWYYQQENFHIYLQVENQPYHQHFSGNITKICKLLILGTNDKLVKNFDFYLHAKNKLHHSLLSWYITF